jgi:uncharacterized protein with HEPN domain
MSRHDDAVRLRHMLEHAREAVTLVRGKKRQDLDSERVLSLALVRLPEIIGEAAGRVIKELQAQNPGIAWPHIVGLRNRLIHGYNFGGHGHPLANPDGRPAQTYRPT